jgi:hypothetical protein
MAMRREIRDSHKTATVSRRQVATAAEKIKRRRDESGESVKSSDTYKSAPKLHRKKIKTDADFSV